LEDKEKQRNPDSPDGLACLITAGYDEMNKCIINAGGTEYLKQEVPFLGRPLLSYVIEAALHARNVSKVFVVGDPDMVWNAAQDSDGNFPSRVEIIGQKDGLIENVRHSIDSYIAPYNKKRREQIVSYKLDEDTVVRRHPCVDDRVLVLTGDSPFIASRDIDCFVKEAGYSDVIGSFANGREYEKMLRELGLEIDTFETKTAMFPIARGSIRSNNMFLVRYSYIHEKIFEAYQPVYDFRKVLGNKGEVREEKFLKMMRRVNKILRTSAGDMQRKQCDAWFRDEIDDRLNYNPVPFKICNGRRKFVSKYILPVYGWLSAMRGIFNEYMYMGAFGLANKINKFNSEHSIHIPNIPRYTLREGDMEQVARWLTGSSLTFYMHRTDRIGPMIDVDVQEMYDILAKDDFKNFKRIREYLDKQE
jgi:hypothetical protein